MSDTTAPTITAGRETAAKRTVIVALVVGGGMAATNRLLGGERPSPRILAGGMVAAVGLTVAAEVAPRPAAAFALLMLAVAVVDTGPELWSNLRGGIDATGNDDGDDGGVFASGGGRDDGQDGREQMRRDANPAPRPVDPTSPI